jgi:hypothetical protein
MSTMMLDVRTLFVADALITAFIGLALLFYWKTSKTYPGYALWMLGTFSVTFSFFFMFLRVVIPVWASVLLVTLATILAALLRLDGIMRFMRGKSLGRFYYATPAIAIILAGYFYFAVDDIVIRTAILAGWICLFTWVTAIVFIRYAPNENRSFYYVAAGINFIYGTSMLIRSIFWMQNPGYGIFDNTLFHSAFFTSVMIYEIWFGILIMMMNNQRLRLELLDSENGLKYHVMELEKAISKIKVLKGLLPICASCKKIRDDQGNWHNLESYIDRHSEATFTHGICPECALKMRKEYNELPNRPDW